MTIPKINSAHGSDTRNVLNRAIDVINVQGKSIQDLVAKGQLTPTQYANLIQTVNGLISKGDIKTEDLDKNNFLIDETMISDSFRKIVTGNAPIHAVPADESLTTRKYVDKSVTPEKTDFFLISNNKFNKNTVLDGKSIDLDGSIINDSNRWLSDYIEVPSNKIMSVTSGTHRIALYDENKAFISRSGVSSDSLIDLSSTPNVKFIRISGTMDKNKVMVNNGSTLRKYVPYSKVLKKEHAPDVNFEEIDNISVHPSQEVHFRNSKNLYNRFKLQKNKTLDPYGKVISEEGRYLSDPIILDPNKPIATKYEDGFRYAIYDRDGNNISRSNKIANQNLVIEIAELPGAYSMLVSPVEIQKDQIMINEGENSLPYEDYGFKLVSTPEVPISIDNSIVPQGSGSGGGSSSPSIAGSTQIFESINGSYASNALTDVYSTTNTSELDYLEFSSNSLLAEIIITYIDGEGVKKDYKIINASNTTELPQTIENMVLYGGVDVEFLKYDEGANDYKIAIKNLKFSNGFKVKIRNMHSSTINIAVQMAGRYYV